MNITWPYSFKKNDIRTAEQTADINDNFDRLFQDMGAQAVAIAAKRISLSSALDVSGSLPLASLAGIDTTNTTSFLRRDGTWNTPAGGYIQQGGNKRFAVEFWDASGNRGFGFNTTPSASGSAGGFQDASSYWERLITGAVNGAVLSMSSSINMTRLEHNPTFQVYMRTGSSIAAVRIFVGLFNAAPSMVTDANGATVVQGAFFRYSTAAADPGWMGVTVGNSVQAASAAQVAAIAASTIYLLTITVRNNGTVVDFSVNNGTVTSVSIATVAAAKELKPRCDLATLANVAKTFDFSRWYYEAL